MRKCLDRQAVLVRLYGAMPVILALSLARGWCEEAVAAPDMKFAWSVPGRVSVLEHKEKGGERASIRYDLEISKSQKARETTEYIFEWPAERTTAPVAP